jgi:predicted Holliday junction resolvase-like endonuclease
VSDSDIQVLFWVAIAVIVILGLVYLAAKKQNDSLTIQINQLKIEMNQRVQQEFTAWRERELQSERKKLSALADAEAQTKLETWKLENEGAFRQDAIRRAQAVLSGKVTEHLAPYLPDFPYDPRDARFLGTPVDLIIFDGMTENDLREIVFLEVKTGSSRLSGRERKVRDAIREKCVSWREFRLPISEVPVPETE